METTRRNVAAGLLAGTSAVVLTGCETPPDFQKLQAQLMDIITKIQQGVKDACSLIPTANSVLAVLQAIAGTNAAVAVFLASTQAAISFISQACPAPSAALRGARVTGKVNDKEVQVVFY